MIHASVWLGLSLLLCFYSWLAGKRLAALFLPLSVLIAAFALWVPTGSPRFTPPPAGKYTVLGAHIDVDVAIYALLDDGKGEPRYYRLPYSTSQANALQAAQDGAEGGQGVQATVDGEGGVAYDGEPPPTADEAPKVPEAPALSIP
ncbi:hypothetical protein EN858_15085 [Mesorhizobium sp. M4B.F.Ca.ET.215.01.1.1]|uniref:hypothetical protein n=1 Tax=unclassified Mesorhizobium TaxID=325217 RepID=UPI00109366FB|nr:MULTISPECIES: hypothetical protein [unclassified Mesorhizobium]TGQ11243.1 hypothetical protein EN858_15085 [Mesorhizobium sp. M4B.F.Ca.ET.215.01.1.1]TGR04704.1 hypothetical protein EN846_12995 [Mesorhizobium sp. M4B.F.Ca.ET.203.01.1.1]